MMNTTSENIEVTCTKYLGWVQSLQCRTDKAVYFCFVICSQRLRHEVGKIIFSLRLNTNTVQYYVVSVTASECYDDRSCQ